jgi:hypothetical protein
MKTKDLTIGTTYAYRDGQDRDAYPAMVLDTKLWTIDDKMKSVGNSSFRTVKAVREASPGVRACNSGWRKPAVGIPVLRLAIGQYFFSGDRTYVETAHELLELAADKISIESLRGEYDEYPSDRMTVEVEATFEDGGTCKVMVELQMVLPQHLLKLWTPYLIEVEEGSKAQAAWAKREKDEQTAIKGETQDIMRRLDALVGANPSSYASDGNDLRRDLQRHKDYTGDFTISKELLLTLLGLAEDSHA